MNRRLSLAIIGASAALMIAATPAGAAPASAMAAALNAQVTQSGSVDLVHGRRWHHRHWHPRRCHWQRVCWWDSWGYRHCDLVRRCHRPRWW
jgi:hypothetical protein